MDHEEYLAWLATAPDRSIAAGAGLWLMDWPPHMVGNGTRGNILNVYTEVEFRRRGLAGELMKAAMQWCEDAARNEGYSRSVATVLVHE